jgi:hypothetical protein
VVSFKPRPLYPQGKNFRYALGRRYRAGFDYVMRKKMLLPPGLNFDPWAPQLIASHYTD